MGGSNAVTILPVILIIVPLLSAVIFSVPGKKLHLCFLSISDWETKPEIQSASEE